MTDLKKQLSTILFGDGSDSDPVAKEVDEVEVLEQVGRVGSISAANKNCRRRRQAQRPQELNRVIPVRDTFHGKPNESRSRELWQRAKNGIIFNCAPVHRRHSTSDVIRSRPLKRRDTYLVLPNKGTLEEQEERVPDPHRIISNIKEAV